MYSNGLLITDKHLETIRRLDFSPVFQISFDVVGGHDQMRGTRGTEPSVIKAIKKVCYAGFEVVVSTSVDRLNIGGLSETYRIMKELAIQSWVVSSPQELGNWRGTTTGLSQDEEAKAYLPVRDRWLKDGRPFGIQLSAFFRGRRLQSEDGPEAPEQEIMGGAVHTPEAFDCGACREQPNLLPDGTIVPCPGYVDNFLFDQMPNLLRQDLSSVWSDSILSRLGNMKKKDILAHNPECGECDLFEECGMGCRASALRQTGDLMAKDPSYCDMWKNGIKKQFQV